MTNLKSNSTAAERFVLADLAAVMLKWALRCGGTLRHCVWTLCVFTSERGQPSDESDAILSSPTYLQADREGGCFGARRGLRPAVWFDSLNVGGRRNSPIFCHSICCHFSFSFFTVSMNLSKSYISPKSKLNFGLILLRSYT